MRQTGSTYRILSGLLALALVACFPAESAQASVTLSWDATTANADGTPCTDLAGYRIYYDTDAAAPPYSGSGLSQGTSPITVPLSALSDPSGPQFLVSGLTAAATYFIVVTAYDAAGNESGFSNEIIVTEADADLDGLPDTLEVLYGLDAGNSDSDGDGISDLLEFGALETPLDSDGDGVIDALDGDSDNDGKTDIQEGEGDTDKDGAPDYRDINDTDGPTADQDGDGISNLQETTYGLNPNLPDSDHDLIADLEEWGGDATPWDTDADGLVDPLDPDSDDDGTTDLDEDGVDCDLDGIPDRLDNKAATMVTPQGKMSVVISHATARLVQTRFVDAVTASGGQPNVSFPYGGVEYRIADIGVGETVPVTLILPGQLPADAEYWKYDDVNGFRKLSSQVSGDRISFSLTDGGTGDDDGMTNGVISDPGFVGIPRAGSVSDTGTAANPGEAASSGGGGGGCALSRHPGDGTDLWWILLPPALLGLGRRSSRKSG